MHKSIVLSDKLSTARKDKWKNRGIGAVIQKTKYELNWLQGRTLNIFPSGSSTTKINCVKRKLGGKNKCHYSGK